MADQTDSTAEFTPLVKLEKVEVKTGEEDENLAYKQRSKLYRFDGSSNEWKERGLGDTKMLQHKENKRVRIILRQEKTGKLVMNHEVDPNSELKPNLGSDRAWTWTATDYSDDTDGATTVFALKLKNSDVAGAFKKMYEDCQKINAGDKDELLEVVKEDKSDEKAEVKDTPDIMPDADKGDKEEAAPSEEPAAVPFTFGNVTLGGDAPNAFDAPVTFSFGDAAEADKVDKK